MGITIPTYLPQRRVAGINWWCLQGTLKTESAYFRACQNYWWHWSAEIQRGPNPLKFWSSSSIWRGLWVSKSHCMGIVYCLFGSREDQKDALNNFVNPFYKHVFVCISLKLKVLCLMTLEQSTPGVMVKWFFFQNCAQIRIMKTK